MLRDETHFVDDFLRANAVNDADQSVRDGDPDKQHVFVAADRGDHESEDNVDEIKKGEGVFRDDLPNRVMVHDDIVA